MGLENTVSVQLVIFDLGRVLIRICDNWRHACEVAGVAAPPEKPFDQASRALIDDIIDRIDTGRIDERIAELQRLRAGLTECIGCGCLSLNRCKFANAGDRVARLGPGPRYWVSDARRST